VTWFFSCHQFHLPPISRNYVEAIEPVTWFFSWPPISLATNLSYYVEAIEPVTWFSPCHQSLVLCNSSWTRDLVFLLATNFTCHQSWGMQRIECNFDECEWRNKSHTLPPIFFKKHTFFAITANRGYEHVIWDPDQRSLLMSYPMPNFGTDHSWNKNRSICITELGILGARAEPREPPVTRYFSCHQLLHLLRMQCNAMQFRRMRMMRRITYIAIKKHTFSAITADREYQHVIRDLDQRPFLNGYLLPKYDTAHFETDATKQESLIFVTESSITADRAEPPRVLNRREASFFSTNPSLQFVASRRMRMTQGITRGHKRNKKDFLFYFFATTTDQAYQPEIWDLRTGSGATIERLSVCLLLKYSFLLNNWF